MDGFKVLKQILTFGQLKKKQRMTFVNLLKDIIDSAKERVKTPISGAFIWSFTLWNWRPIFLLLYSDASIEDKIVVINNEYCSFWALFFPLCLAFFYVLVVPKIMVLINEDLEPTIKKRVEGFYSLKTHSASQKKVLAGIEYDLKNIENGSKQIEDYLEEIESLKETIELQKESIKQINETNKSTIDELNNSLKAANEDNLKMIELNNFRNLHNTIVDDTLNIDEEIAKKVVEAGDSLTFNEFKILKAIKTHDNVVYFGKGRATDSVVKSLSDKEILYYKMVNDNYEASFTEIGAILFNIIKSTF